MNISFYNLIGHIYLLSRPYVYNGGFIGQILTNFYVTDTSNNLNISLSSNLSILNYIQNFFLNVSTQVPTFDNFTISYQNVPQTNLITTFAGFLYIGLFFISCIVSGFIWICCQTCKKNLSCKIFRKTIKYVVCHSKKKQKKLNICKISDVLKKRKYFFNKILFWSIICYFLLSLCIICFIFSLTSQIYLQQQIINTSNYSFYSSWTDSTRQLNEFFIRMVNESYQIFNNSIAIMSISLEKTLFQSVSNLTSELIFTFGINYIFNGATQLIKNLKDITQSMQYIIDNTNSTVAQINYQTGYLEAIIGLLTDSMNRVCINLPKDAACLRYLNNLRQFQVIINPSIINADSSITMIFLLNQMQLNITSLAITFSDIQTNFNNKIVHGTNANIKNLNLGQSIGQISSIWPYISQSVSPLKKNFAILNTYTINYMDTYSLPIFVTIFVLLFLILVVMVLYALALYRYSLLYYLQRKKLVSIMNMSQIFLTFTSNFHEIEKRIHNLKQFYKVNNYIIYSYIIISSFVIILILSLSLIITNASHLLYNEACVQLWRPEGLLISDSLFEIFLNDHWNDLTTYILSKNPPIQFIFPKPTKVFNGIRSNCTANHGIFYALQMSNFVNISSFLWSPNNYKSLNDGLNLTYNILTGYNVGNLIPEDMTSLLKSASSISAYFDNINYQRSIDELSKGVISIKNYSNWTLSAIQYFSELNTQDSMRTVSLLNTLNSNVPNIQKLELAITNLRNNFQIIQIQRTTTALINGLLFNISTAMKTLNDKQVSYQIVRGIYNRIMLKEFTINAESTLNVQLTYMINHLFPCVNLSSSIFNLLDNICTSDSTIEKMVSNGLNISITCGIFMFMLHVLWSIVRKDMSFEKEHNISKC